LRNVGQRQLNFAFADSLQGGKGALRSDESDGRAYLLHTAKSMTASGPAAGAAGATRLLTGLEAVRAATVRHQLKEPDVRPTSPVLWEGWRGAPPPLPDTQPFRRPRGQEPDPMAARGKVDSTLPHPYRGDLNKSTGKGEATCMEQVYGASSSESRRRSREGSGHLGGGGGCASGGAALSARCSTGSPTSTRW